MRFNPFLSCLTSVVTGSQWDMTPREPIYNSCNQSGSAVGFLVLNVLSLPSSAKTFSSLSIKATLQNTRVHYFQK